jgi:hypothetical protein
MRRFGRARVKELKMKLLQESEFCGSVARLRREHDIIDWEPFEESDNDSFRKGKTRFSSVRSVLKLRDFVNF